jgi:hypothetical protein
MAKAWQNTTLDNLLDKKIDQTNTGDTRILLWKNLLNETVRNHSR